MLLGVKGRNDGRSKGVSEEVISEPGLGLEPGPKSNAGSLKGE